MNSGTILFPSTPLKLHLKNSLGPFADAIGKNKIHKRALPKNFISDLKAVFKAKEGSTKLFITTCNPKPDIKRTFLELHKHELELK